MFKKEHKDYDKSFNLKWTYSKGKKHFAGKIIERNSFVEVAEWKGKIVGYLCGGVSIGRFSREKAKYAELHNMFVLDEFRSKGIGTKLAKDFISWCKKKKIKYIAVTASAKNNLGINFYRKLGFKDYNLTLQIINKKI